MHAKIQIDTELDVFQEFAAAVQLPIIKETICHRNPPDPDIFCEIAGEGPVGFELTELVHSSFMASLNLKAKTEKGLSAFWRRQLPDSEANSFRAKYSNAILSFWFRPGLSYRKRSSMFCTIFQELLAFPDGFVGDALKHDPRFLPALERVKIFRGSSVGPGINVHNFGLARRPHRQCGL